MNNGFNGITELWVMGAFHLLRGLQDKFDRLVGADLGVPVIDLRDIEFLPEGTPRNVQSGVRLDLEGRHKFAISRAVLNEHALPEEMGHYYHAVVSTNENLGIVEVLVAADRIKKAALNESEYTKAAKVMALEEFFGGLAGLEMLSTNSSDSDYLTALDIMNTLRSDASHYLGYQLAIAYHKSQSETKATLSELARMNFTDLSEHIIEVLGQEEVKNHLVTMREIARTNYERIELIMEVRQGVRNCWNSTSFILPDVFESIQLDY